MADRAAETGAVVIGSMRGVHFGNEVLNWHRVGDLDGKDVFPGLLITKTHPNYFRESYDDSQPSGPGLERVLVVPLKAFCRDETDFLRTIERIFSDLRSGLELRDFDVARYDARQSEKPDFGKKIVDAIEVKPGAFGVSVDLKALLLGDR